MKKKDILKAVCCQIKNEKCLLSGRVYGSWLCDEKSVDLDIAVIIKSDNGIIDGRDYLTVKNLRTILCEETGNDIDLIPHTVDEFTDKNSPLWYPRYNPSLVYGKNIKGNFPVFPISESSHIFGFPDLTAYVLHDNRTICRRQMVRSLTQEEGRIFVSKLSSWSMQRSYSLRLRT